MVVEGGLQVCENGFVGCELHFTLYEGDFVSANCDFRVVEGSFYGSKFDFYMVLAYLCIPNKYNMTFSELNQEIAKCADMDFVSASNCLETIIFGLDKSDILDLVLEIGTIPENIAHDSTEEKLYTRISDILFAKALKEMNFTVQVLRERADCADIIVQSRFHKYSFVGDAKAFRLSRTAKNAKDFKVSSMDHWRGDCDYSVLACPYFQYPKSKSQIYKDALEKNVALFSWEYLYILLKENVQESAVVDLRELWNQSAAIYEQTIGANLKSNFLGQQNLNIAEIVGIANDKFDEYFSSIKEVLIKRGNIEIAFYENEINRVKKMNREEAIKGLLISMKLDSKISTIKTFIEQIKR